MLVALREHWADGGIDVQLTELKLPEEKVLEHLNPVSLAKRVANMVSCRFLQRGGPNEHRRCMTRLSGKGKRRTKLKQSSVRVGMPPCRVVQVDTISHLITKVLQTL